MNDAIRALFPVTRKFIYLNSAAAGPRSTRVHDAMVAHIEDVTQNGSAYYADWCRHFDHVRRLAARLTGAEAGQIAFMRNTSDAISTVANGMDWRSGDNVVTANVEFPAIVFPWTRQIAAHGISVRLAAERDGRIDPGELLALVDDRTRAVAASWVQYANGFRADLRRIGQFCRERNILFVVDAIQGLGGLQLDVVRDCVDVFAADGHKYLCGPEGNALLYVAPHALEHIQPTAVGWMSVAPGGDPHQFELQYREGAARFECGTLNAAGVYGLGAAIELFLEVGQPMIEAHLLGLSDYLSSRLVKKGYQVAGSRRAGETSGIVACTHPHYAAEVLQQGLRERNIITAARAGRLRFSLHIFNTRDEVDAAVEALPD